MQPIKIWRKQSALFGSRPEQQLYRVITSATHAVNGKAPHIRAALLEHIEQVTQKEITAQVQTL